MLQHVANHAVLSWMLDYAPVLNVTYVDELVLRIMLP